MRLGPDIVTDRRPCLKCGYALDRATGIGHGEDEIEPGNFTVCIYCGHAMAFDDDLAFRELTGDEKKEVDADPDVIVLRMALSMLKQ